MSCLGFGRYLQSSKHLSIFLMICLQALVESLRQRGQTCQACEGCFLRRLHYLFLTHCAQTAFLFSFHLHPLYHRGSMLSCGGILLIKQLCLFLCFCHCMLCR